jgi:hypothetical protein
MSQIALFGGEKVKKTPFGTGKRFGDEELLQVKDPLAIMLWKKLGK